MVPYLCENNIRRIRQIQVVPKCGELGPRHVNIAHRPSVETGARVLRQSNLCSCIVCGLVVRKR